MPLNFIKFLAFSFKPALLRSADFNLSPCPLPSRFAVPACPMLNAPCPTCPPTGRRLTPLAVTLAFSFPGYSAIACCPDPIISDQGSTIR